MLPLGHPIACADLHLASQGQDHHAAVSTVANLPAWFQAVAPSPASQADLGLQVLLMQYLTTVGIESALDISGLS